MSGFFDAKMLENDIAGYRNIVCYHQRAKVNRTAHENLAIFRKKIHRVQAA